MRVDETKRSEEPKREGSLHTYVWQDAPSTSYPEHSHAAQTAYALLSGEMALAMNGRTVTYRTGGRS